MIRPASSAERPRRGAQDGATAVEFAMIAAPLFFIIMATLELAMIFIVSTLMEGALSRAAREIRTGQQQTASAGQSADVSEADFKENVCDNMVFLAAHCRDHFYVDVRGGSFGDAGSAPDPVSDGEFNEDELTFQPGGTGSIVLVRGFYEWPLFTPLMTQALAKVGDSALLMSADTFRNEPF